MNNFRDTRAAVLHLTRYIAGKTVDYGAGSAKYKNLISPHTSEYIAFDMVPGKNIDVVGDALNPPFPDAHFDTVISTQMLEHVEKPWVVVQHIKRILKPGGTCIVTAPFLVPFHAYPHDYFRYTEQGLRSLFLHEGFTIEESGTYGNTPSVLTEMARLSHFYTYDQRLNKKEKWGDRFMQLVKKIAYRLDNTFQNDAIYSNTYLVARKEF